MQTLDLFHDGAMLSKGAQGVIQGYVGITGFDLGLGFGIWVWPLLQESP